MLLLWKFISWASSFCFCQTIYEDLRSVSCWKIVFSPCKLCWRQARNVSDFVLLSSCQPASHSGSTENAPRRKQNTKKLTQSRFANWIQWTASRLTHFRLRFDEKKHTFPMSNDASPSLLDYRLFRRNLLRRSRARNGSRLIHVQLMTQHQTKLARASTKDFASFFLLASWD